MRVILQLCEMPSLHSINVIMTDKKRSFISEKITYVLILVNCNIYNFAGKICDL